MKKPPVRAIMMLIPATLSSNSNLNITDTPSTMARNIPHEVSSTRSKPTKITHLDYISDTGAPRGHMIDLRLRPHIVEIPVSEPPHFLLKFQATVDVSRAPNLFEVNKKRIKPSLSFDIEI